MANKPKVRSRYIAIAATWLGACLFCIVAMIYFYGLFGAGIIYPFRNHSEQGFAVFRTAVTATIVSSWAIWLGARGRRGLGSILLRTGLATQASLALYAIVGLRMATADWRSPLDFIFPATFFAEYNWLTFILEVAPVTSVAASLLLYLISRREPQSVGAISSSIGGLRL